MHVVEFEVLSATIVSLSQFYDKNSINSADLFFIFDFKKVHELVVWLWEYFCFEKVELCFVCFEELILTKFEEIIVDIFEWMNIATSVKLIDK